MINFADLGTAKRITKSLYPNVREINFIEHGYDNIVGLVDEKYVLKFPRNQYAYLRDQYEKLVLMDLVLLNEVFIPKVLSQGDKPPYFVTSFISGKHLSSKEINDLSVKKQQYFGEKVARFAFAMHSMLSPTEALENRKKLGFDNQKDQPWVVYFEKLLSTKTFPTVRQDKLAKKFLKKWLQLKYTTPTVVVHDDLQTDNLMFEDGCLVGVIDFGDTILGNPEQEFRQMYRINDFVLDTVVKIYEQLSGYKLNMEAIKLWAILQELAVYYDMFSSKQTDNPKFVRASNNLQKWLPTGDWTKD